MPSEHSIIESSKHPSRLRPAFTLVELLVVIAVIGILTGMMFPAIMQMRETARRVSCSSNIAQLGLAIHNFEMANEFFPPGVVNDQGPIRTQEIGQHVSFLVLLLPFIEQRGLADHFEIGLGTYAAANAVARDTKIALLVCPSFGSQSFIPHPITTYAGSHHGSESPIADDNNGLLFLNSHISLIEIYDGSSNTMLLGEFLPEKDSLGWASGTRSSLRNTSQVINRWEWDNINQMLPLPPTQVGGFGSSHHVTLNVCFADGSVRGLAHIIDPKLFGLLGDRADGELMSQLP